MDTPLRKTIDYVCSHFFRTMRADFGPGKRRSWSRWPRKRDPEGRLDRIWEWKVPGACRWRRSHH